ncbi:O-antigen polymerase [Saccharicrinis sp. FJH2]|uniref:O-antigen polymerase n=1 Tax=Saccharicrinis sp. FJH65 TaxID=3344659 RepID=UPI0035F4ADEB
MATIITVGVYFLGWSDLYPQLRVGLVVFLILSSIVSIYLGAIIDKFKPIEYHRVDSINKLGLITILVFSLFILEFVYNKGIPLLLVFSKVKYEYNKFGIPFLHPLLTTFTSFFSVYIFHAFISTKRKKYILYFLLYLSINVLVYNRGMFIIILTSCFFVYITSVPRIPFKVLLWGIPLILVLFYGFGVLGNYRLVGNKTNEYFLKSSKATKEFKESIIPDEYLWAYMYISSPLANLQHTIDENPPVNNRVKDFVFVEILPDFLSKRIAPVFGAKEAEINRVSNFLTVGTIYARSYSVLGWLGIYLIFIISSGLIFLYIFALKKTNPYYVTGIAILCTFVLFNMFSNMIYFSGISFQLVFPLLLGSIKYKKGKLIFVVK